MKYTFHLLFFCLIGFGCKPDDPSGPDPKELSLEETVLELVNTHRTGTGLPEIELNETCTEQATLHSQNMASGLVEFGHDGFDARFDIIVDETGANSVGENVAAGYPTAEDLVQGWLDSPTHKDNIEGDFTHMGLGVAESDDGETFYTQIFAKIPE